MRLKIILELRSKVITVTNNKVIKIAQKQRECGDCTVCCHGWLPTVIHGKPIWPGRKCDYVGSNCCTIYEDRPTNPCKEFKCAWLMDHSLPEWFKPNLSKVLCVWREIKGITFLEVIEAGQKMDSEVLSYIVQLCAFSKINIRWQVNSGWYYYGSDEFVAVVTNPTSFLK